MMRQIVLGIMSHHYILKASIACGLASAVWGGWTTSHMPGSTSDAEAAGAGVANPLYVMKTVGVGIFGGANKIFNPEKSPGKAFGVLAVEGFAGLITSPLWVLPVIGSEVGGALGGLAGNHFHVNETRSSIPQRPAGSSEVGAGKQERKTSPPPQIVFG